MRVSCLSRVRMLTLAPSMWSLAPLARVTKLCVGAVLVKNSVLFPLSASRACDRLAKRCVVMSWFFCSSCPGWYRLALPAVRLPSPCQTPPPPAAPSASEEGRCGGPSGDGPPAPCPPVSPRGAVDVSGPFSPTFFFFGMVYLVLGSGCAAASTGLSFPSRWEVATRGVACAVPCRAPPMFP